MTVHELPDGRSRCSTRTSGNISANDICAEHGGGGHFHAAGFRLTLEQANEILFTQK